MRYILVPGGWHGAWAYDAVAPILTDAGHVVEALTLAGLDGECSKHVNLDHHIEQVVQAIGASDVATTVVGHSYGGMVITGAADRATRAVDALVYADAYVPEDRASVWALTSARYRELFIAGAAEDGLNCAPPPHLDKRCRPQSLACFVQAIKLNGNWPSVPKKVFILAGGGDGGPFVATYDRLRDDPAWSTHRIECAHDIPRLAPQELARILLQSA